ncbi:nostrin [Coregonus clupeaformis]|uniref:nostrin n=1 Tax=Coregonus clupeaformis TaxID=59861 RepID=UPI001E1C42E1|nr:nostrin [Coregonus clupeaformis]XP_041720953.2 nostrin [Coregonus clupeaformis]
MADPVSTCAYNLLYQDLKKFSKNGEHFCKELMTVFQQRAELEISYAKGLQKLAGKLMKASKGMNDNSTYQAWCHVSDDMYSTADTHRALGSAFQAEAILEIRQVIEEHNKRKRPLDNVVEKNRKLVVTNWSEQIKIKKKLVGLTREHEALFNFVKKNTHICTEKEKQKILNRQTKSAEAQTRTDEEYFTINMDGHQIRLKWENTLKNCYQIIQELEKQRIEILCNILNKYNLHMASFRHTLVHSQKQIEQAIQRVDVEKDIQSLVEETSVTAEENKAKFLMTDYFEEDSKSLMEKGRRRDAIKSKLQRLGDSITKTKKDCEVLERLVKTYSENPSFSNKKNLEETEQLIDETTLKLNLLEATHCKLSTTLAELEGKPQTLHRFSDSITKWKEKDCEHSIVQLARPVKIKKTPFRSHLRSSIIYKGPYQSVTSEETSSVEANPVHTAVIQDTAAPGECGSVNGAMSKTDDEEGAEWCSIGKCKAVYDFTSDRDDELNMKEGDLLDIYQKEDSGWWYGILNGQIGHFPSTYVEELPMLSVVETSDV